MLVLTAFLLGLGPGLGAAADIMLTYPSSAGTFGRSAGECASTPWSTDQPDLDPSSCSAASRGVRACLPVFWAKMPCSARRRESSR